MTNEYELQKVQKENEILRLELEILEKKKQLHSYGGSKLITSDNDSGSMNLQSGRSFEEFRDSYVERAQRKGLNIKGRNYEQIMEELSYRR